MNDAIVTQADRDNDARIDAWKARQIEASRRIIVDRLKQTAARPGGRMNTVHNPSGCMSIRIRHAHRVTLSQRLARAFAAFSAALAEVEHIGSHA